MAVSIPADVLPVTTLSPAAPPLLNQEGSFPEELPILRALPVTTPSPAAPPLLNQEGSFSEELPSSDEEGWRFSAGVVQRG